MKASADIEKLRRIYRMLEAIELMDFNTDEAKDVHGKLLECIKEVIKPELVKTGNKLKENGE